MDALLFLSFFLGGFLGGGGGGKPTSTPKTLPFQGVKGSPSPLCSIGDSSPQQSLEIEGAFHLSNLSSQNIAVRTF